MKIFGMWKENRDMQVTEDSNILITSPKLIEMLRGEANEVKDCFTRFSFHGLLFGSAFLGLVFRFQSENPYVALLSILVIFIVFDISKIGIHKYRTANRNFGFEIFLNQFLINKNELPSSLRKDADRLGWEEVMHAWRAIHFNISQSLFKRKTYFSLNPYASLDSNKKFRWYMHKDHFDESNSYKVRSYVKSVHQILFLLVFASIALLISMIYQLSLKHPYPVSIETILLAGLVFIVLWESSKSMFRQLAHRRQLEKGIDSIYICAILWNVVVLAHLRALSFVRTNSERTFFDHVLYNKALSDEIKNIKKAENIYNIYDWIENYSMNNRLSRRIENKNEVVKVTRIDDKIVENLKVTDLSKTGIRLSGEEAGKACDGNDGKEVVLRLVAGDYELDMKAKLVMFDGSCAHIKFDYIKTRIENRGFLTVLYKIFSVLEGTEDSSRKMCAA